MHQFLHDVHVEVRVDLVEHRQARLVEREIDLRQKVQQAVRSARL